ncbi:hypothetical protein HHI36_000599 [Cryptolaemus montrouzieri]|uniref:UDP-glucuronosyltransferase n=1 Tax=Cryptolaemus montrouzieri TaxID=559131 RepID=A0ABD2P5J4_9CUCU
MRLLFVVLLVTLVNGKVECARILGIFMGQGQSHYSLGNFLMKSLVESGHEGFLISRYGNNGMKLSNYTEIVIPDEDHSDQLYDAMTETKHNPYDVIERLNENAKAIIPKVFENSQVKEILNTTFDVVIVEQIFTDALKVLAWHFKAPLIVFHPFRADIWINSYVGNPNFPSFIPEYATTYNICMNLLERIENVALYFYDTLFREYVYLKEHNQIMKRYFPDAPDLSDIAYNTSLVLLNSDISIDQPIPKVPNMIDIGGFNIIYPKPLPADVFKFLDNSTKGVVYINLDMLTSNHILEKTRNYFVKLFSSSEYDFLWQWDEERVPNQSPNILVHRELPQQDVLAHPKVKLFINIGELQSIIEGVNYGIPQILIPILADQLYNAAQAHDNGYAWTIPFSELNEVDFGWAIRELLDNPKYYLESQSRSKILKEKLVPPKKAAIFWVEYVLKTDGAKHMRVGSLKYSWYQLFLLDVFGIFAAVLIVIIILLKILVTVICRKCCCCKRKTEKVGDYVSVYESEML